jgi:hypothetical protein
MDKTTLIPIITPRFGYCLDAKVPARFEVCGRCHGEGRHSNPSIDGHGMSHEELHEDPDFAERYFSGVYDVICEECSGKRVVLVPDESKISEKVKEAHEHWLREDAKLQAEMAFERRWGA